MRYCRIEDVMTDEVVTTGRDTPFKQVARLLSEHRISGLPVVDDEERVLGVISETDLLHRHAHRSEGRAHRRARLPKVTRSARAAVAKARAGCAEDLMSRPAVTAFAEQYVTEAARSMREHSVERLPVLDDSGRLVGIVTRGDLLRVFLRPDEEIRRDVSRQVRSGVGLPRYAVDVTVDAGVVTLRGHLERRSDAELAVRIAGHVDGVVAVTDHLTHRPAGTGGRRSAAGPAGHM